MLNLRRNHLHAQSLAFIFLVLLSHSKYGVDLDLFELSNHCQLYSHLIN